METEKTTRQMSGWLFLVIWLALIVLSISGIVFGISQLKRGENGLPLLLSSIFGLLVLIFLSAGFFTVEPNTAVVLLLFGKYVGTERIAGFKWANPLYTKRKISLRVRNFDSQKLKVNDKNGNPIEISAVVVWRVENTAQAVFDVDNYEDYVTVQSESAIRRLASAYAYDAEDPEAESLRSSMTEVSENLQKEIQDRVTKAGVVVGEARINHLAYAPEIASAMLQRQQAEAIIAARHKIVEGAVSMVDMALEQLRDQQIVELDEERKAMMVSNLMVVLCSDKAAQPILNAGTLY